jgi:hypothetical protein
MAYEEFPKTEHEPNPERVFSREEILEEILLQVLKRHEKFQFKIERELRNAEGIYLLEALDPKAGKRYTYQRKGSFEGRGQKIESSETTIRSEDLDDGYSRTLAGYDPTTDRWKEQ